MGEEYAETAPFPYFISHGDKELVEAVRQGRIKEFAAFVRQGIPPDPQSEETFLSAKLDQEQSRQGEQRAIFNFYRELIAVRKEYASLAGPGRENLKVSAFEKERVLLVTRITAKGQLLCLFNYSDQTRVINPSVVGGTITVVLDSTGSLLPGSSITVYTTRPQTFSTLPPFGVIVYKKEK
jgi:maltooligosyltrehalose trehalohydrolase